MSAPGSLDSLETLEKQAYVALFSLHIREEQQAVPEAQRRVSLSLAQNGRVAVMTVTFPVETSFSAYTPTVEVIPWLA